MKQTLITLAVLGAAFAACNNVDKKTSNESSQTANRTSKPSATNIHEITDPVCGMVKDSTWTDYTLYKGDTVWFCAAAEKEAFLVNPKKYENELPNH